MLETTLLRQQVFYQVPFAVARETIQARRQTASFSSARESRNKTPKQRLRRIRPFRAAVSSLPLGKGQPRRFSRQRTVY